MQEVPINYLALLAATVARMVVGGFWYSPIAFVRPWMALTNTSEEQIKAGFAKCMVIDFIGSVVMAFVLIYAVRYAGAVTPLQGAGVGFVSWAGFIALTTLSTISHERQPFKLWLINNGFMLISLLAMGAIIAAWI